VCRKRREEKKQKRCCERERSERREEELGLVETSSSSRRRSRRFSSSRQFPFSCRPQANRAAPFVALQGLSSAPVLRQLSFELRKQRAPRGLPRVLSCAVRCEKSVNTVPSKTSQRSRKEGGGEGERTTLRYVKIGRSEIRRDWAVQGRDACNQSRAGSAREQS
jgi:hypothetical protein